MVSYVSRSCLTCFITLEYKFIEEAVADYSCLCVSDGMIERGSHATGY